MKYKRMCVEKKVNQKQKKKKYHEKYYDVFKEYHQMWMDKRKVQIANYGFFFSFRLI